MIRVVKVDGCNILTHTISVKILYNHYDHTDKMASCQGKKKIRDEAVGEAHNPNQLLRFSELSQKT
jgi:hypothetical protein